MNPYSPPRTLSADTEPFARKRWVIVLLALIAPPIAMLYVGRPVRAAAYFGVLLLNLLAAVFVGARGIASPQFAQLAGSLFVSLIAALDGFRLARNWHRPAAPWYARAPGLVGILIAWWLTLLSVRGFAVEPFRIPSAAMEPTLKVGDHILVKKWAYGWNIPLTTRRLVTFNTPARGDVAVFRYPVDEQLDYIKRVVGLPGDSIAYAAKRLSINGQALVEDGSETLTARDTDLSNTFARYQETLGGAEHAILLDAKRPVYQAAAVHQFSGKENCEHRSDGFTCKVPAGHYFVMGDHRDHSSDSRYWGFVPEANFVGRATIVWYSPKQPGRAGTKIK